MRIVRAAPERFVAASSDDFRVGLIALSGIDRKDIAHFYTGY
jgi:hypothetical protein